MRKIIGACLVAVCIPYIVTLAWTGRVEGKLPKTESGKKTIILDQGGASKRVDLEEYLVGVTAVQIPASCEEETLKAQAVIARTYLYGQMEGADEMAESAINMSYLNEGQMEELWGPELYLQYYKKLRDAVSETRGQVITCEGALIDPLFHKVNAGMTRQGDELHPYLQPADGHLNLEAENYMSFTTLSEEEFAARLNSMNDPPGISGEQVLEHIQIVEKDEGGYVTAVQIGEKTYSGDEVAGALGLKSPAFSFESYEGSVRCTVKGVGHGYGFDQYGANLKAREGWKAEDILKFYYKNIVVISE